MIQELLSISKDSPLSLYDSVQSWSVDYFRSTQGKANADKATYGGFMVEQFSFAFMAGYQAALSKMFPEIEPSVLRALCVSEEGGVHPKSIQTTLEDNQINGLKTYVTAGTDVEHLFVLCKTTEKANGRVLLKMVHLPAETEDARISNFELPFMKEVKHGKVAFNDTQIASSQILEGDGYDCYAKPFRTIEDIHLNLAYHAMLLRQALEFNWDKDLRDKLLLNIFGLKSLSRLSPVDQETILLVNAIEENFEQLLPLVEENIAKHSSSQFKADWEMNKRLTSMGKKVKSLRLAKARKHIFQAL